MKQKCSESQIIKIKALSGQRGSAVMQVMFISSIIAALSLIMTIEMNSTKDSQGQQSIQNNLIIMREQIKNLILDSDSWAQTINRASNNGSTGCLLNFSAPPQCNQSGAPALSAADLSMLKPNTDFENANYLLITDLMRADNTVFMNSTGTNGFTDQGTPCNTFDANPAVGNPDCPVQWVVRIQYICPPPGGPTCFNPQVHFVINLYYHPGPNKRASQSINQHKYRLILTRGETGPLKNQSFELSYSLPGGGPAGGGACNPLGWIKIPLNIVSDPSNPANATLVAGSARLVPGTYSCSASSSCWECGSLAVRLFDESGNRSIGTSQTVLVGAGILARAELPNTKFTLNGPSSIAAFHYCQQNSPAVTTPNSFGAGALSLGMTVSDYTNRKAAVVRCLRIY